MSEIHPIGLTKGPGETPHEFTFVSPDRDQSLKVGEFITYRTEVDKAERDILSRVTERRPLRLYPDAFLADPDINPDDVAALVGYYQGGHELFELTASVIGYYEQEIGDFINPRLPPRVGRPLYLADDHELAKLLSKSGAGEIGSAYIGSLLSRGAGRVPISVDVAAITSTHLAIIANTGAGKSYLAAVLIEELMKPYNRAAVLIVDPHGEYQTLTEMQNNDEFSKGEYRPQVKIFLPGEVKVRTASLGLNDLNYLLPNLTERMEYLLRRAYMDVRNTTLLRRLFHARVQTEKGQVGPEDELYLPYPTFVLIEEAHHFAPAGVNVISTNVLKQVLTEGRKFGVSVGLISQRPGRLDPDVLSQCNSQFILRIVNPIDQSRVAESVETVGRDLLRELPSLTKGQAIIAGEAVNTPVLCRVRSRHTPHGAETKDAPSEWLDYFSPDQQARRDRRSALPIEPERQNKTKMFK